MESEMEIDSKAVKVITLTIEYIKIAWSQSIEAHTSNQLYLVDSKKHGASSSSKEVMIITFKGPLRWHNDDLFGVTDVDAVLLPSLLRIGEGLLAKVNSAFLDAFKNLLKSTGFKLEVEKAVKKGKKILFAGHASGGAIASLATLWVLEEYARKQKVTNAIGCVTFGSPLIGDGTVTHAVQREKWGGHFTHFVMEHDIVPRIMLAPKTSIQKHLPTILDFLEKKVDPTSQKSSKKAKLFSIKTHEKTVHQDHLIKPDEAVDFFENVMINALTVASHDAFDLMEPTSTLKEKLSADFVKVSPYRPFGHFVFCTRDETQGSGTSRQLLVVENPNAILQLLFYFLQLPNENQDLADFALNSLDENFGYEEELNKGGLQLDNMVNLKDLNQHLMTSNGTTSDVIRASNRALSEQAASAKWCLMAVEEAEKRKKENELVIKKSMKKYGNSNQKIIEVILDDIRTYKKKHADGTFDYYEAFKNQNEQDDFVANVNRLELAKIWDVTVEMVLRRDLPDEFEVWGELVNLGTQFRRLVEPLDIGNYYRHSKGDGYMDVRPKRYKFTQRWYEHANVSGFEKISESNFVAAVEELTKKAEELKNTTLEKVKEELENIKSTVGKWKNEIHEENEDVYWGDSIVSKLQEKLL
uniref:protein EDS1-like n=1 Tax=Erigeron canadensis TaxID=72917 RepID=UPI001CB90060|nr:protein EDS1-like [Erigeron canadensis]